MRRMLLAGVMALVVLAGVPTGAHADGGDIAFTGSYCPSRGDLPDGFALGTFAGFRLWGPAGIGTELSQRYFSSDALVISAKGRPGGGPEARITYTLRNGSIQPFPLFMHLYSRADHGPLFALLGVGAGYQMAFVQGDSFNTQIFGGWGGTAWSSIHRRLSSRDASVALGIGVEARYHVGRVKRNAFDAALAIPVRQEIDVTGMSVGLTIRMAFARNCASRD